MTRDAAILRSVLSDQVKDRLLQAILEGRYPPGARIIETRVARELGTSQAPVREALRDLEALGVVETTAFRGARVRRPSADELLEAFTIRAELESLAARLAIPRLTDGDLEDLAGYVGQMQRAAESGNMHDEATADASFHGRIVERSGNATLERVWRTLEPFSRTYITIVAPGADRRRIADEHLPVLAALRRRDPALAVEVLHEHFARAAAMLARLWDGTGARPDGRDAGTEREPASPPDPLPPSRTLGPLALTSSRADGPN
ncbi:MAG: GntR family transcriptional regulator [Thermoplasmata archaeon]|nr:GntR family transcriptional regulator [Thermoplasmata archaeon]